MTTSPALRIAVSNQGVSVWSTEIFGQETNTVRLFLARAFSVEEVHTVEWRRGKAFGRIRYGKVLNPKAIWKKLSAALASLGGQQPSPTLAPLGRGLDVDSVYLEAIGTTPVRITRIGAVLSTWRVRSHGENTLNLTHPALRNRRDVAFRLEEELAAIWGVEDFSVNALTASVSIRFDADSTNVSRIARQLEKAWPRLLDGLEGPPSRTRLFAAFGLLGLAYTGQYLVPAVRPFAVAGVALYGSPNLLNAAKDLRHARIGLPALYSTGLGLMLYTGLPFTASVMASFMQFWPRLTRRTLVRGQRRLFSAQRRRPTWARLILTGGQEVEVHVDELRIGDRISVRPGELVPVDGVVEDGSAAIADVAFGAGGLQDATRGDHVAAGALLRDGEFVLRVERTGAQTAASHIDSLLPHGTFQGLPAVLAAERIASRNVKPTLAVAALNLGLTKVLRPSQAVIRADYATALRLSAQLATLEGVAEGWQRGVLLRNPGALDRLAAAEVFVLDDSAGLARPRVEVSEVLTLDSVSADLLVRYALGASRATNSERTRALASFVNGRHVRSESASLERAAGVTRYRDVLGVEIQVVSAGHVAWAKLQVPERFRAVLKSASNGDVPAPTNGHNAPPKPLWVLRDGALIGVITFALSGEPAGKQFVESLQAQNKRARIIYLSRAPQRATRKLAHALNVDASYSGLGESDKVSLLRSLDPATVWIGDGADPTAREVIAASGASISVAPLLQSRADTADILLLQAGLASVTDVIEIARNHRLRLGQDYAIIHAMNLGGALGGFLAGLTPLHTGLLSNVGAGLIYARRSWALRRLIASAEQQRERFSPRALL